MASINARTLLPGWMNGISESSTISVLLASIAVAGFWSTAFVEVLAAGLLVSLLVYRLNSPGRRFDPTDLAQHLPRSVLPALGLWLTYIGAVVASFLFNHTSFVVHPGLVWHPLLFPAIIFVPVGKKGIVTIGKSFLCGGAIASALFLIRHLAFGATEIESSFVGLTTLADLLALTGIVAIAFLAATGDKARNAWLIVASGFLILIATCWTSELAPVLVLFLTSTVLFLALTPALRFTWLGMVTVSIVFSPMLFVSKLRWMISGHHVDRYVAWREGARLLMKSPLFGYGPECYERVLPPGTWAKFANKPPGSWHNDFLQTGLDSGPIAGVAFAALVLFVLGLSVAVAWKKSHIGGNSIPKTLSLLLVGLVAFATVGGVITTTILSIVFWSVLGINLRLAAHPAPKSETEKASSE
jgi:O-antigen ligase